MGQPAAKPLAFVHEEQAGVDAASKLIVNFERIVQDITNQGSTGIGGGQLTQDGLERVDPKHTHTVRKMLKAACCYLMGQEKLQFCEIEGKDEALVWNKAAKFLGARIQGSRDECEGREPDMGRAEAEAMRKVLGRIEVSSKLICNRDSLLNDTTNTAPKSQKHLKRVDGKYRKQVDTFMNRAANKLRTGSPVDPSVMENRTQVQVEAEAAGFLAARIQEPADWQPCQRAGFPNRKSDMNAAAAGVLRSYLGKLEAGLLLMSNRDTVVNDITNPGPEALKGGAMTQTNLKRVDSKHKSSVAKFVDTVGMRLLGHGQPMPSQEEASVWVQAAAFLSARIQGSDADCEGRNADMSTNGAREMRAVLAQVEAGAKLISNRETVVKDITNPGPVGVGGGGLTQTNLKRVDSFHQSTVDAMVRELCSRLFGQRTAEPSSPTEAQVWAQAAVFFNARIQGSEEECPGRNADMSCAAAEALRGALSKIACQTKNLSAVSAGLLSSLDQL